MKGKADSERVVPDERAAEIDVVTRVLHFALVIFGVAAWLTGDLADEYEHGVSLGFTIHRWVGISAAVSVGARLVWGLVGPRSARFATWLPATRERLRLVVEDVQILLRFQIPERPPHQGLAGVVQTIGLLIFGWVAATGSVLFFALEPGVRPGHLLDFIGGLHAFGEALIPAFLAVHVGATIAHALAGDRRWRTVFFLSAEEEARRSPQ